MHEQAINCIIKATGLFSQSVFQLTLTFDF